jgi:hypothetical protein
MVKVYSEITTILLLITTGFPKAQHHVKAFTLGSLLPEIPPKKIEEVSQIVSQALDGNVSEESRKIQVQELAAKFDSTIYEQNQFVYGELSIPTLATLLDAVGVYENERFLDIGSGDGALVFATALLFEDVVMSRGVEIVPSLFDRSEEYRSKFADISDRVQLHCGDIYDCNETLRNMLGDTTLAVCFATTWSRGNEGRRLPELSNALGIHLNQGARAVVVDGKLDEIDGFSWDGDLKIHCPDTAPYSIASLYTKK